MSEATTSQIAFARDIVRFAAYQFVVNCIPIGWAIWAFVIGVPDHLFWPSLWGALAIYAAGTLYLIVTIFIPAMNKRLADRELEKN